MNNKTVIISCAGIGSRLGAGKPKALIDINGRPLISYALEHLKDVDDVRIVVGYQADKVIETVLKYRRNVLFVYNNNYMQNGTGASVSLAKKFANEYFITIDGDIIVHPEDFAKILNSNSEFVGTSEPSTDDPVLVTLNENGEVTHFSRNAGTKEWTGVTMLSTKRTQPTDGHVYGMIEPLLPVAHLDIRIKEIDTPNDYKNAIVWVENGYK